MALTFAPASGARGHRNRPFASLPHLGPAPNRCELGTDPACPEFTQGTNFTVESSCGAINISPHIVNVGEDITATMAETARQCRIQWTPPGKRVAGLGNDGVYQEINPQKVETITPPSSNCQWKATTASSYPPDALRARRRLGPVRGRVLRLRRLRAARERLLLRPAAQEGDLGNGVLGRR